MFRCGPEAEPPTIDPGHFVSEYHSTERCDVPRTRPDWGTFSYVIDTPSDSTVEFQVQTSNDLATLGSAPSVFVTGTAPSGSFNVGDVLVANGLDNFDVYARVTAHLLPSSDMLVGPTLHTMGVEYTCFDGE